MPSYQQRKEGRELFIPSRDLPSSHTAAGRKVAGGGVGGGSSRGPPGGGICGGGCSASGRTRSNSVHTARSSSSCTTGTCSSNRHPWNFSMKIYPPLKYRKFSYGGSAERCEAEYALAAAGVAAVWPLAACEVRRLRVRAAPANAAHGERCAATRASQPVRGTPQTPVDAAPRAQLGLRLGHVRTQAPRATPDKYRWY